MLDFLTFALCVPYSETTDGKQFDQLLEMVASRGRIIFKLFEVCFSNIYFFVINYFLLYKFCCLISKFVEKLTVGNRA